MGSFPWIVLLALPVSVISVRLPPVDVTDRPDAALYERDAGHYMGRYMLGQAQRRSPSLCAQLCDETPRCMGFNYFVNRGRCSMVTHNRVTNPVQGRYREQSNIDHYIKLDAIYECPPRSFRHPYKARCYTLVNRPMSYIDASRECRRDDAQLALIPNRLAKHAIWNEITERLQGNTFWLGLEFRRQQAFLTRNGQKAFFSWLNNLYRGLPTYNRKFCGLAMVNEHGKFDYRDCSQEHPFICEYRSHTDTELNEICPHDTGLFDGNCFWSTDEVLFPTNAAARCESRGGFLAAYASEEAISFIGNIWEHIVPSHVSEAWIGLKYETNRWMWSDGDQDMLNRYWAPGEKRQADVGEICATAKRDDSGELHWFSYRCNEERPFMCMGTSGVVLSNECPTRTCPDNSICKEGHFESICQCLPGFVTSYQLGQMACMESAVCISAGDPHYTTWDGGHVTYQGRCRHLLCGSCPDADLGEHSPFEVIVNNQHRDRWGDRVTFTEWTEVHVYEQEIRMGLEGFLLVNGIRRIPEVTLYPFDDTRYIQIISRQKKHLLLTTDFGLQVEFQQYRCTVIAPTHYTSVMCGICGNFNGNYQDDMHHDQDQWQLSSPSENEGQCVVDDPYFEPECTPALREYAERKCGLILTMPDLSECREGEDIQLSPYYTDCMEDACAGGNADVDITLCNTMDTIVSFCQDAGYTVSVSYRSEADCPMDCQENAIYQSSMSLDVSTCQNPDALYEVSRGTAEGCACAPGYIMDGGNCIGRQECGCTYGDDDLYMELGGVFVNEQCTISAVCDVGGEVVESDISCGAHASCVLNDEGVRGCECNERYEGDPYDACHHEDACPYPMPGDIPDDSNAMNIQNAIRLNINSRATIDPTQHTEIIHIQPGGWLVNPLCQIVTCFLGEEWDVGESVCVPHSHCEPGGPDGYQCVCDTGYVGNGTTACNDDTSGTGDPHFMVTSHTTGQHMCFDFHGYRNEVWQLIYDESINLTMNGELFETNTSTPTRPVSYFARIGVRLNNATIIFSRDDIMFNDVDPHQWEDNIHLGPLHFVSNDLYDIRVSDDVTLRVSRAHADAIGHYLGVYVVNSDGLSENAAGIIGQFIKTSFDVRDVIWTQSLKQGTIVFQDEHASVEASMVTRFNRAHHGQVNCWLYHTQLTDDTLLGSRDNYTVDDLV